MEVIKAQLLRIQQQLSGLNASQKMLTASLVAIMLITIVWWTRYAGTAEMQPVVGVSMNSEETSKAQFALSQAGIPVQVSGDKVLVPTERRLEALRLLNAGDAMPAEANPVEEMMKLISPWDSKGKIDLAKDENLQHRLSECIRGYFPGVIRADVLLNTKSDQGIGATGGPSGSVMIRTHASPDSAQPKALAKAIAAIVSKSVNDMKPSSVSVTIDGKLLDESNPDDFDSNDMYVVIQKKKQEGEAEMLHFLPPGSQVLVDATLDTSTSTGTRKKFDKDKAFTKPLSETSETKETSQTAAPPAEPGAVANGALNIASSAATPAGPISTSNSESTSTQNEVMADSDTENYVKRGTPCHFVSAAVKLAYSDIVKTYKREHGTTKEPEYAEVLPLVESEINKWRDWTVAALSLSSGKDVAISTYFDDVQEAPVAAAEAVATASMTSVVGGHAKEISLGALAAISLFMVSMMVKKGVPTPALPAPAIDRGPGALNGLGDLAGFVNDESSGTLEGVEVDEKEIQAHRVVEQVSAMVKEDPDAAANLVKRWMNRS